MLGELFYSEGAKVLAGTGCPEMFCCPISRGIQGQVGWDPGQPDLVGDNPAHGRGVGIR